MSKKRHPLNVAGPFYVEDGCCTACGLPYPEAPDLLGVTKPSEDPNGYAHCYFKKQPVADAELEQVFRAIMVAEFRCFRYAGSDAQIIARLQMMGDAEQCDVLSGEE